MIKGGTDVRLCSAADGRTDRGAGRGSAVPPPGPGLLGAGRATRLAAGPASGAPLGEGAHPLAHVLRREGRAAQLDQLRLDAGVELALGGQQRGDHALVAALAQWRVAGQLGGNVEGGTA